MTCQDLEIQGSDWAYADIRASGDGVDSIIRLFDDEDYWSIHHDDSADNELNIRYNNKELISITPDGNIGVARGTLDPTDKLTVNGTIRLIPRSTARCNLSHEGAMYYDTEDSMIYICVKGQWDEFRGPRGEKGPQGSQGPPGPAVSTSAVCGDTVCDLVCTGKVVAKVQAELGGSCFVTSDTGDCQGFNGAWCCVCSPSER